MATTPTVVQEQAPVPAKVPVGPLMMAVVLGVIVSVAAVGGAGYFLIHSGKLRLQTMPPATLAQSVQKTHSVLLEPLVVNLADASGAAYLRVSMALSVADTRGSAAKDEKKAEGAAEEKGTDAAVRDTALEVLSKETSASLLAADGKERTKKALKDALAERVPEMKIVDLYFTEFLVQR
ncbi:MAG TPA: flagellar basal body-associated FliL family protein [Edaphobacter sp.]